MFEKIIDIRPWGQFIQYTHNQVSTIKIIEINPQQKLSVQRHKQRDEMWIPLDLGLYALIGDKTIQMFPTYEYFIPRKTIHSIENLSPIKVRFLEISLGNFDENDIERISDKYERK